MRGVFVVAKKVYVWSVRLSNDKLPESKTNPRCLCVNGIILSKELDKIKERVGEDLTKYELNKDHQITVVS